jgi:hypothetical protein
MANKTNRFAGLSDDQVLVILSNIAATADLMAGICRERAEAAGTSEYALTFHALDTMLRGVGALADMPTGGNVCGDFQQWMLGPMFHQSQKSGGAI